MEGHCSTGQNPQWAVVTMEEGIYGCTAMKMEALRLFETLLTNYQSTLCKIQNYIKGEKNCTCPRHEGVRGNRGVNPFILNFYTRWK